MTGGEKGQPRSLRKGGANWGRRRIDSATQRIQHWSTRMRMAIPALDLGWEFFSRFRQNNGAVLVGHISYRLFLWLAPLMLVLAAGLGFSNSLVDLVRHAQELGVPERYADDAAAQAENSRTTALAIGLPALVFASWGLVRGLHYGYSQVWGIEIRARKRNVRAALATVLGSFLLAGLTLVVSGLQRQGLPLNVAGAAGSFLMVTAVLWVLQWFMPRRTDRWYELLPGPVFGAFGFACLHLFASIYLPRRIASASVLYGSIGVALGVMFYIFLVAYLLVIAPFLNAVWVDRAEILDGRPWVNDPEVGPNWARGPLRRLLQPRKPTSADD